MSLSSVPVCDLTAVAVCLAHNFQDLPLPYRWLEEREGQLGPGCLAPSAMSWTGYWDVALRELPAELCLLSARTWTSEGEGCTWDLALSCQNRE